MKTNPLFLSLLAAVAVCSLPSAAFADDHHGGHGDFRGRGDFRGHSDFHGDRQDFHRSYSYRDYGHYRFRCAPRGGIGFFFGGPSYYYDAAPVYYDTAPVYSDEGIARDVQYELHKRGYYHGGIDGDIGPASRAAIRGYQADRGLPITGVIDTSLLRSLGLA
jgi:hypothetical protein